MALPIIFIVTFILIFTEKTFSSLVFFFIIVFIFLLLLYITLNCKLCSLQIDRWLQCCLCFSPFWNPCVIYHLLDGIPVFVVASSSEFFVISRLTGTASLWPVFSCATYKIQCYLRIYNISVENWIKNFNFRPVITNLVW